MVQFGIDRHGTASIRVRSSPAITPATPITIAPAAPVAGQPSGVPVASAITFPIAALVGIPVAKFEAQPFAQAFNAPGKLATTAILEGIEPRAGSSTEPQAAGAVGERPGGAAQNPQALLLKIMGWAVVDWLIHLALRFAVVPGF